MRAKGKAVADEHQHYFQAGAILVAPGHTYLVLGLLGEGGMALVYACLDRDTGQEVAIKLLRSEFVKGGNIHLRFERESRIPGQVIQLSKKRKKGAATKCLLQVLAIGELADGTPYYAMTRLSGCTLQEQIRAASARAKKAARSPGLPLSTALNIGIGLLLSLEALHQCGVVHRDIKPANIFLHKAQDEPDAIVLLDYGVAHLMDEGSQTGVAGTAGYIAPEHFTGKIGPPADIFAMGVLLFKMIAGVSPADVLKSSWPLGSEEKRKAPSLAPFGAVPALADLVARCLAVEPRDRPTAADLHDQLQEIALALPEVDVGTAVTEDDPIDRAAAGDSNTGLSIAQVSPATSPDMTVTARMNALRAMNERRAALGLPQLTQIPNNETTPMLGRPSPAAPEPEWEVVIPMAGRRQKTVPMGGAHLAQVLRPPVQAVTMPPPSSSPSPLFGPVSQPEYAPPSARSWNVMKGPEPTLTPASAKTNDGPIAPARGSSPSTTPATLTALAQTPRTESRRLERVLAALRERSRAFASRLAARRERSAIDDRETSAAAQRERIEKPHTRAARVEAQRLATVLDARDASERELAEKQRQVEHNRQRMREAEARGERWTGDLPSASPWRRLPIAVWVVAICLGFVGVLVVRRQALRAKPAAPAEVASAFEASALAASGSKKSDAEVALPASVPAVSSSSKVADAEVAPPALVLTPPSPPVRTAVTPRARPPASVRAPTTSATAGYNKFLEKAAPTPTPPRPPQIDFE